MKNIFLVAFLFVSVFSPVYSATYNTWDLSKFEESNRCTGCDLSGASLNSNHSGAILDYANLSNINGEKINLSNAILEYANLSGAHLQNANFSKAWLTGAHFDGAHLFYANFFGAKGVDLTNAVVCSVILPDGKVSGCDI